MAKKLRLIELAKKLIRPNKVKPDVDIGYVFQRINEHDICRLYKGDHGNTGERFNTRNVVLKKAYIDDNYNIKNESFTVQNIFIKSKNRIIVTYRRFRSMEGEKTFKVALDIGYCFGDENLDRPHLYSLFNDNKEDCAGTGFWLLDNGYSASRNFRLWINDKVRFDNRPIKEICQRIYGGSGRIYRNHNIEQHWIQNIGDDTGIYRVQNNDGRAFVEKGCYKTIQYSRREDNDVCYVDVTGVVNGEEFSQEMAIIDGGLYYDNGSDLCYTSNIEEAILVKDNLNDVLSGDFEFIEK